MLCKYHLLFNDRVQGMRKDLIALVLALRAVNCIEAAEAAASATFPPQKGPQTPCCMNGSCLRRSPQPNPLQIYGPGIIFHFGAKKYD